MKKTSKAGLEWRTSFYGRRAFGDLPLETALALFPLLNPTEQVALQPIIFGKIISLQTEVRRAKVPPDEKVQALIRLFVEAAQKKSRK